MIDTEILITLREYEPLFLPALRISQEDGKRFWQQFGKKINISGPSFINNNQWELTSQGWIGFLPFSPDLIIHLEPKVPLKNLFGMWEYAYRLQNIVFLPDLYECATLQQFYEQLVNILSKRILDRGRKGYYRAYISRNEDLSFLRGRLDLNQLMKKPWEPKPHCDYQENSADVAENQILAWTINRILRSGFCTEKVLPHVRNCHRHIRQAASLQPFNPTDCIKRLYNRLNQDYQPLHGLCRFFLENSGPSYKIGDHTMVPFLVDMWALFELFVAEWLKKHLPSRYQLIAQEELLIGNENEIRFKIDMVIYDKNTNLPICVLDTKYKKPESISNSDIEQINLYANAKQCNDAVLVYPGRLDNPLDVPINKTRIRTATFSLDGDLEKAGESFLSELLLHELSKVDNTSNRPKNTRYSKKSY